MTTARFLHAADLHLGSPLKSLGDAISDSEHDRVKKLVNGAFERLVQTAIDEDVDFCVFAGDVYDTADRDPGAQRRFLLGLRTLETAGIKVFMVHGNHDPLTRDVKHGLLPENVTVFAPGQVQSHVVTMRNGAEVTVAGVSYGKKEESENLVPLFAGLGGRTIVGVLHTNVGGNTQHGNYAPCTPADLSASPVHYWALGHIHLRSVNRTERGWWVYPGNLQGRSVKAAECGPKGVVIVDVDQDGSLAEPRFVECCKVRFERVSVDVGSVEEIAGLNDAVVERLQHAVDESGDVPLLVRLELTGQSDLAELLKGDWDGQQLVEEANEVLGEGAVVKVRSSISPRIDLNEARSRDNILGAVLNELDRRDVDDEMRDDVTHVLVNLLGVAQ